MSAWNRGPPTELIFEPSDAIEFPPLASTNHPTLNPFNGHNTSQSSALRRTGGSGRSVVSAYGVSSNPDRSNTWNASLSNTGNTLNNTDTKTIEELIASAVAASEAQTQKQFADIVERQSKLDQEIASLRAEIASQTSQIIDGTIKALSGSNSPFLNKADALEIKQQHHDTQSHIRNIQQTLTRFMQHVTASILPVTRPLEAPNEDEFDDPDINSPPRKISRPPVQQEEPPLPANPTAMPESMDWGGED
jgi:hypothetical protein